MRRFTPATVLVACSLVTAAAFAADDLFTAVESSAEHWENSVVNVARGSFSPGEITGALRALPGEQRAAWVRSLGGWARTYTQGEDFAKRYKKAYKEWKKSHGGGGGGGFGLGGLKRKLQSKAEQAAEKQVTGEAGGAGEDRWAMDEDANVTLKKRLTLFLELSKDVDFDARLEGRRFADATYEAKPGEWKMCYRAGREATAAAREVATAWLADLDAAASADGK